MPKNEANSAERSEAHDTERSEVSNQAERNSGNLAGGSASDRKLVSRMSGSAGYNTEVRGIFNQHCNYKLATRRYRYWSLRKYRIPTVAFRTEALPRYDYTRRGEENTALIKLEHSGVII